MAEVGVRDEWAAFDDRAGLEEASRDNGVHGDNLESRKDDRPVFSLFVRNLNPATRFLFLKKKFEKYGEVRDVYIPRDFHTKEPRGFAYVQYLLFSSLLT
jgi:RNA recognition motif-containing protein